MPNKPGKVWQKKEFAEEFRTGSIPLESALRKVANWEKGQHPPQDLRPIEKALFGDIDVIVGPDPYSRWRADFRHAHSGLEQTALTFSPIPRVTPHFLGRDQEIAEILGVLLGTPATAILVQGGPGIGKTALTQAVGNHRKVVLRFGEQTRWFVPLEAVSSVAGMQDAIAGAIGADPKFGFTATLKLLRQRPGLLVLDNLETPWEQLTERRATEDVLAALADIPGLGLLVSFRGRDHIGGAAWALVHSVAHLAAPHDTELFRLIAQGRFDDDLNLPHFMAALGGIPLAIELVAKRAYGRSSLAVLWAQWNRIGADLAANPDFRSKPNRLTSLPHSIELSLASSRMSLVAWRIFRLLGQLPAGLADEDRDRLLAEDGFDGQEVLFRIGLAVERNCRLDLLPPIREHARQHHPPIAPEDRAWPEHYLTLTRERGPAITTRAGKGATARLVPEFANIEASIYAVLVLGDRRQAMNALPGLNRLSYIAALPSKALADLAIACRNDADLRGEADCIRGLADIARVRSDQTASRIAYEQALDLYRQDEFVPGEASCIERFGDIALSQSDYAGARLAYKQALGLYRQTGNPHGKANCIFGLGGIAMRRSRYAAARGAYEQALKLYQQADSALGEADCVFGFGEIALRMANYAMAQAAYEQALPLYQEVGAVLGEANCVRTLGEIALIRSDCTMAQVAHEQALQLYRKVGSVLGEANCILGLGDIALKQLDHEAARTAYEKGLLLYRQVESALGEANCIEALGDVSLSQSDEAAAQAAFEQALPLYRQVGSVQGEANCMSRLEQLAKG